MPATNEPEPFAEELAIALDDIETLTKDDCACIVTAMNWCDTGHRSRRAPEPLSVFLALHARLGRILASGHAAAFCRTLREWGANSAIDAQLWRHWGAAYRAQYKPAVGVVGIDDHDAAVMLNALSEGKVGPICAGTSRFIEAARAARGKDLLARIEIGDVIRYRWAMWKAGDSSEYEIFGKSNRGSLWCRVPGKRTKFTLTPKEFSDPRFEVIEVRKLAE